MAKNKVAETICWLAILALLILSIANVVYKVTKQTLLSSDKDYHDYGSIQVIGSNSSGSYQTSEGTTKSVIIR
ncbi:hypothetical protein ABFY54_18915 [Priestia megaterium]|uniref:Uncharacterized protein n=1 Tax=Priestia aryabhattai TaxID=412384 RepID=A0ABD5KXI5_PRIAR|nr:MULTISPECIES: hypothetical protein [Priestia]MBK0294276.1 hypothetical protein [Bacillus sp. S34]UPK51625.1 hypothetical protein MT476_08560 [Bacillus sp. H8-1]MBY0210225.1 hypothetical protein [Priestia aryabhattai]MDC7765403.1 hypothetical protein [Priestia aryabhattai]MEB4883929.1 hypothetical protein [Priestia megaterium]